MTKERKNMGCHAFQAQMADLIGSGEDIATHFHLQTCAICRHLLADLEAIAEAARQLFPIVEPREELWGQIESAIQREKEPSESS